MRVTSATLLDELADAGALSEFAPLDDALADAELVGVASSLSLVSGAEAREDLCADGRATVAAGIAAEAEDLFCASASMPASDWRASAAPSECGCSVKNSSNVCFASA